MLKWSHEEDNLYDIFSMKVCKSGTDEIADHLAMQISRITKFIMAGGVSVTLEIIGKYHRRSHLVQGGFEGPCEMTIMMSRSVVSHLLLTRYEKMLHQLYIEPKNEEIVWTFLLVGNEEGEQAEVKSQQQKSNGEKRRSEIKGHSGYVTKPKIKKG